MALKPDNLNEKKELVDQIDVMKAKEAGSKILVKGPTGKWSDVENPSFNWGVTDYGVRLDYTDFLNQAAMSLDYVSLSNKLNWMERGEKLENVVDYSVQVLENSKSEIINNLNNQLPGIYGQTTIIDSNSIVDTEAFNIVRSSIHDTYYKMAVSDTTQNPDLIMSYGSTENYFNAVYKSQEDAELNRVLSGLDTTVKNISSERTTLFTSGLVSESIDNIIFTQKSTPESSTYSNTVPTIDELKDTVHKNMKLAIDKFNNCKDGEYICQIEGPLSITLKKQWGKETPAVCIKYGLDVFHFNDVGCPQIEWDFNREGDVKTITGATEDYVKKLTDNIIGILEDKLLTEKEERQLGDNAIRDSLTETFNNQLNAINERITQEISKKDADFSKMLTKIEELEQRIQTESSDRISAINSLSNRISILESIFSPNYRVPGGYSMSVGNLPFNYSGRTGTSYYYVCTKPGTVRLYVHDNRNAGGDSYFALWKNGSELWRGDIDYGTHSLDVAATYGDVLVIETLDYSHNGNISYDGQGYSNGNCVISMTYV